MSAPELTADQGRVLELLAAGWRLRDWNAGMSVRALHPDDETQRVLFGRSSLMHLRGHRLVRSTMVRGTPEWTLTSAGRKRAAATAG